MIAQLRSELLKLRSTRTNLALLVGMILIVLFFVLVNGLTESEFEIGLRDSQRSLFVVSAVAALFAALVGIMGVTSEYRYGTIRPTLLFTPRRGQVVAAKVGTSLLMGVIFGLLAAVLAFAAGYAVIAGRGTNLALNTGDLLLLFLGTIGMAALWAGLGSGVGSVVRNQVGAIVGMLVWILLAENLLFGLVPSVGRFGPATAGRAMTGDSASHLLSPLAGACVLIVYVVLVAAVGAAVSLRRDVP